MTFQPPPPPPPQGPPTPPPPPPGQWGPPPGQGPSGAGGFDPKSVNSLDWAIIGLGVLTFIFSTFDYYTASFKAGGFSSSGSESAWNGFFGWFGTLAAVVGAAAIAVGIFAPHVKLPFADRVIALIAWGVAALCLILALFIIPIDTDGFSGVSTGHGFGYWGSLVFVLAGLVLTLMRAQQTGTALPGPLNNLPKIGK